MRIGELARRTGTTPRALRYYEEQRLLTSGRGQNGYREYGEDAVVRVVNIRHLLDAGLNSDDIRALDGCLAEALHDKPGCAEAVALYERRLAAVQARVETLEAVRGRLTAALAQMRETARTA